MQYDVEFAIPVEISNRDVAGTIAGQPLDGNVGMIFPPHRRRFARRELLVAHDRTNEIAIILFQVSTAVDMVARTTQRTGIDFDRLPSLDHAINVECGSLGIRCESSPADIDGSVRLLDS